MRLTKEGISRVKRIERQKAEWPQHGDFATEGPGDASWLERSTQKSRMLHEETMALYETDV